MSSLSEKVSEIKKQKEASQLTPSHGSKPIRFSWEKKKESKLIRIGTRSLKDDDGEPVSVFTIVVL